MSFPLPIASQEHYTKWFQYNIKKGSFKKYTIVWVGKQLKKRFKSEVSPDILPENVFICQKKDNYEYILIDKNDDIFKLPKKHYTSCFPGIQYSSIPHNNRIKVKISENVEVELPFIPQSFLDQKRNKTGRKRRRLITNNSKTEKSIDFNEVCPEWHVLQNNQNRNSSMKKEVMLLIRSIVKFSDKNINYTLKDPFENITNVDDLKKNKEYLHKLKIISGFIHHYCRSELGIINDNILNLTLSEWILKMNSID